MVAIRVIQMQVSLIMWELMTFGVELEFVAVVAPALTPFYGKVIGVVLGG